MLFSLVRASMTNEGNHWFIKMVDSVLLRILNSAAMSFFLNGPSFTTFIIFNFLPIVAIVKVFFEHSYEHKHKSVTSRQNNS